MKTYVLIISNNFPKTHNKSGKKTDFIDNILLSIKKHTIRGNYELWKKRFEKIEKGEAYLSIRSWSGKPYKSKQIIHSILSKKDGISLQKLDFFEDKDGIPSIKHPLINNFEEPKIETLAANDGLSYNDFKEWFKKYDISESMAIIQLTNFKY